MLALVLLLCGQTIEIPEKISGVPGQFIPVRPTKTDGKIVQYYPIDEGLSVFPAALLADTTATVVTSVKPGTYRLLAYTAVGDKPSAPVVVTIIIGNGGPIPPLPPPPPPPFTPVPPGFVFPVPPAPPLPELPPAPLLLEDLPPMPPFTVTIPLIEEEVPFAPFVEGVPV